MSWSLRCDICGGWTPATVFYSNESLSRTGAKFMDWLAAEPWFEAKVRSLSLPEDAYRSVHALQNALRIRGLELLLAPGPDGGPPFCFECGRPYEPAAITLIAGNQASNPLEPWMHPSRAA